MIISSKQPFETTVQNLLARCNIMASASHVKNTLHQHPDYPSTLTIVETLPEWGVASEGVRGIVKDLTEVDYPSIIQLEPRPDVLQELKEKSINIRFADQFVVLESMQCDKVTLFLPSTGRLELSVDDFSKIWSGVLIRAFPGEGAHEKDFDKHRKSERDANLKRIFLWLALPTLTLGSFALSFAGAETSIVVWSLFGLKALGLTLCDIMSVGGKGASGLLASMCPMGSAINCQRVLHSPAGKIFGMPMSDIGVGYFGGGLLTLLLSAGNASTSESLVILGLLSVLALPYTVFSVAYQGFILRSWCWMCLVIQAVFWMESWLLYDLLTANIKSFGDGVAPSVLGFGLAMLSWVVLKSLLDRSARNEDLENQVVRLRSSPENIQAELSNSEQRELGEFPLELQIGNPEAQVNITAVVNPLCTHCGHSIAELEKLVETGGGAIKASVRFLVMAKEDKNTKIEQKLDYEVSRVVLALVADGKQAEAFSALQEWFASEESATKGKYELWQKKHENGNSEQFSKQARDALNLQVKWALENKIMSTPTTFVNNTLLPSRIQLADMKYFFIRNFSENRDN